MKKQLGIALLFACLSLCSPGQVYFLDDLPEPSRPSQPSLRKISGLVTDPSGAPVAGAEVNLQPQSATTLLTDAQGKFEMVSRFSVTGPPAGNAPSLHYTVMARHPARNLVVVQPFDSATTNLNLQLKPGVTIAVKVQDTAGIPITNASVNVSLVTQTGGSGLRATAKADAKGVIEVGALLPGEHYRLVLVANGYGSTNLDAEADQTAGARFDFPVVSFPKADRQLAGVVVDELGHSLPGVTVSANTLGLQGVRTQTDDQGRFRLTNVMPGRVAVSVSLQSASSSTFSTSTTAMADDTNVVIRFDTNRISSASSVQYIPRDLTGLVSNPSGQPAARVTVSLVPQRTSPVQTDSAGRYHLHWETSVSRMSATTNFRQPLLASVRDATHDLAGMKSIDDNTTNLDLKLGPALTLAVQVRDPEGKEITGAYGLLSVYSGNYNLPFGDQLFANTNGIVEVKGLPAGQKYRLNLEAPDFGIAGIDADATATTSSRLELPPVMLPRADKTLAGQVVDAEGKPVSGANVTLQGQNQRSQTARANSQGRFQFDKVVSGTVRISALNFAGPNPPVTVEALAGDTNVIFRLTNNPNAISARGLYNAGNRPSNGSNFVPAAGRTPVTNATPQGTSH